METVALVYLNTKSTGMRDHISNTMKGATPNDVGDSLSQRRLFLRNRYYPDITKTRTGIRYLYLYFNMK